MNDSPAQISQSTDLNIEDIELWYQKFVIEASADDFVLGENFKFWSNHFKRIMLSGSKGDFLKWLNRFGYG